MMQEHARRTAYGANNNFIKTTISLDELIFINSAAQMVTVNSSIYSALTSVMHQLDKEGIKFSDRKLNWCIDIVRAQALLSQRMTVVNEDIMALTHVLWEQWSDIDKIKEILLKCVNPLKGKIESEFKSLNSLYKEAENIFNENDPLSDSANKMSDLLEITKKTQSISAKLNQLFGLASRQNINVTEYVNKANGINQTIQNMILQAGNIKLNAEVAEPGNDGIPAF